MSAYVKDDLQTTETQMDDKPVKLPDDVLEALHKPIEDLEPINMKDMLGVSKGAFKSIEEIDQHIRDMRDEW